MGKVKELMYGDTIENVAQLKLIMSDLDDCDQLTLVTCDEHGDEQDHYPMAIDVIDNIRLTDDTIVREVQFVQRPNCAPDTRDKQPLVDAVIADLKKGMSEGDDTVLDELLKFIPWEILKGSLPEDQWSRFNEKENVRDGAVLIPIPSQCPFAIADFKAKYMQTHEEVCLALGYDEDDDGANEMILGDGYFWLEHEERWLEKTSSMYDSKEQELADWLRG